MSSSSQQEVNSKWSSGPPVPKKRKSSMMKTSKKKERDTNNDANVETNDADDDIVPKKKIRKNPHMIVKSLKQSFHNNKRPSSPFIAVPTGVSEPTTIDSPSVPLLDRDQLFHQFQVPAPRIPKHKRHLSQ